MGRTALPVPSGLALKVAEQLGRFVEARHLTDRRLEQLTRELGTPMSDSYLRERIITHAKQLTIRDVQVLCQVLEVGMTTGEFIQAVDAGVQFLGLGERTPDVSGVTDAQVVDERFEPDISPTGARRIAATQHPDQDQSGDDGGPDAGGNPAGG